jgi:hypothetical protein
VKVGHALVAPFAQVSAVFWPAAGAVVVEVHVEPDTSWNASFACGSGVNLS